MHKESIKKEALLILTHEFTPATKKLVKSLNRECPDKDVIVLWHQKTDEIPKFVVPVFPFKTSQIFSRNFELSTSETSISIFALTGATHFPVLEFFNNSPNYDYYWVIEGDVRFSGKWSNFFNELNLFSHDFMSSHMRFYEEEKDWKWWNSLKSKNINFNNNDLIASLNVIYRISNKAINIVNSELNNGIVGHYEIMIPTILNYYNLSLLDFGGVGSFVPQGFENKNYIMPKHKFGFNQNPLSFTMSVAPARYFYGAIRNKLYHPVKSKNLLHSLYMLLKRKK
jgi:hypothetical protein